MILKYFCTSNEKQLNMEIVMVKKVGCTPCKMFEPTVKEIAEKRALNFRTIQQEDMPEEMRPPYFPFFFLFSDGQVLEQWGGTSDRKLEKVLDRHTKK